MVFLSGISNNKHRLVLLVVPTLCLSSLSLPPSPSPPTLAQNTFNHNRSHLIFTFVFTHFQRSLISEKAMQLKSYM